MILIPVILVMIFISEFINNETTNEKEIKEIKMMGYNNFLLKILIMKI